jgi:phage-related protein
MKSSSIISRIINACRKICDTQTQVLLSLVSSAFSAIKIIAETAITGEESAMTSLLPTIIGALKQKQTAPKAVAVLPALPYVCH